MSFVARKICLLLIRAYQGSAFLLRPRCRFWPTCSHYTYEAVEKHGAVRGLRLGLRRILRCQPLGGAGYDPVPVNLP